MVQHQELHLQGRHAQDSPTPYMLRMTAIVTSALTIAGGSWYVAVDMTTPSDLTAIYNCSAFFAYAFSIPLLKEKPRFDKILAVLVAIVGVLVVAYGDTSPAKHGGKSGGSGGGSHEEEEASNRALGNIVIGIGSVLYGFYEVLYKKVACPPDGCSPGRGMAFALTFGSLIGSFTLLILWFPLPLLHVLGWETFELPRGRTAAILLLSVAMNASKYSSLSRSESTNPMAAFSGSFLILISLTSPVLSSVAALYVCPKPPSQCPTNTKQPHNLPGRHSRLGLHRHTAFRSSNRGRSPDHRSFLAIELEYFSRNERGEEKEVCSSSL
jgi:drug/metabolite transporter (DMT)-like permease